MKYARLINGNLQYVKMPLKVGDKHIFTNDKDILAEQGYKPVVYDKAPTEEGYYAECIWDETDTEILQIWVLKPIEEATNGAD